ncbi:MAG: histidinol dehydrogenase [Alphaproteobacteria bacterium]|nr:histidinol dehydrogenase [Alphaproteobacteria bacterium]MCD8520524.1 histidinol dehydrogenase [Alphaproteobacteria bacterium]MCD8570634.1 histidinol dehydrogenase [Alphaproteobacteria bacterium]
MLSGIAGAMTINLHIWAETDAATKARLLKRAQADIESVMEAVKPIIADVKARGDAALIDCAAKFEKAQLTSIRATEEEFEAAEKSLDDNLKAAIRHCAGNVRKFHEEQMARVEKPWMVEIEPGVMAGEKVTPIPSVGLYVPRGKGAFPSALYMLALPAKIAGVPDIAVVTPPRPDGKADDATLFTAKLCGIENVYTAGGAQAIAALAYGTQTIPAVRKVVGPSSPYAAAAKKLLADIIDPGMPAGPSEAIVLADETANPYNTCLDILNEAEHGMDSAVLLVTHDKNLASFVQQNLPGVIAELPEPHRSICASVMKDYGGIVLTNSLQESIDLCNEYAPEHLHLKVKNHDSVLPLLHHAGEILIGEFTPSTLGNYGIGVNHVLPTGGWAKTYSCTSVWDFLKRTSLSQVTPEGFARLKESVLTLTDYEGFPAHGAVLRKRKI